MHTVLTIKGQNQVNLSLPTEQKNRINNNNTNQMLSPHFSLQEMKRSATAITRNIDNEPNAEQVANLQALCQQVLEPIRKRFGVTRITSAFRSETLNKAVNGAPDSQHLRGEAADIHVSNIEVGEKMFEFIKSHTDFDQLILERKKGYGCWWIHVSYSRHRQNRHHAFSMESK